MTEGVGTGIGTGMVAEETTAAGEKTFNFILDFKYFICGIVSILFLFLT